MTSNDVKIETDIVGIKWPLLSIKLIIKPIKSGIVVIYSPNNEDFRCFQSKLTKIDVKYDVKWRQNRKKLHPRH